MKTPEIDKSSASINSEPLPPTTAGTQSSNGSGFFLRNYYKVLTCGVLGALDENHQKTKVTPYR